MAETTKSTEQETVPFYPDHVRTELRVAAGLMALILLVGILGMIFPVGVGEAADPMNTPAHVKPEWYFLSLYQLLKFIPKTTGAVIPVAAVGLLMIWPFIDRKQERWPRGWQMRLIGSVVVLLILVGLTIWGEVS